MKRAILGTRAIDSAALSYILFSLLTARR